MLTSPSPFHTQPIHKRQHWPIETVHLTIGWVLMGAVTVGLVVWAALGSAIGAIIGQAM